MDKQKLLQQRLRQICSELLGEAPEADEPQKPNGKVLTKTTSPCKESQLEDSPQPTNPPKRKKDKKDVNKEELSVTEAESENFKTHSAGWKVINEIPADDSDISDAFENDLDEDHWQDERVMPIVKDPLPDKPEMVVEEKKPIKNKTLQRFLDEFGLNLDELQKAEEQKNVKSKGTTIIVDYSTKRKKEKKIAKEQVLNRVDKNKIADDYLDKARWDIYKIGNEGIKESKKEAKLALVYKLGGKLPKNKAMNYKLLMMEKKLAKADGIKKKELMAKLGQKVKKAPAKKRVRNQVQQSQLGTFKNGVLRLSKKDLRFLHTNQ